MTNPLDAMLPDGDERLGDDASRSFFDQRPLHERPRERLSFLGASQLNDDELLALVFGSGGMLRLARDVLDMVGGPPGLLRVGLSDLQRKTGIGPARACQLKAALELGRRAMVAEPLSGHQVRSAADMARLLQPELGQAEQEAMHVFGLDARNRIRSRHVAALGQVDRVHVSPTDVFRPLLREAIAGVLIVHNHPSGDVLPSEQDRLVTTQMIHAGLILGIPLLDHLIISTSDYFSFADAGWLASAGLASTLTGPTGSPLRNSIRAAEDTDTREPGKSTPVRFNGSAALTATSTGVVAVRGCL
jgi:DNA repair protein RadC